MTRAARSQANAARVLLLLSVAGSAGCATAYVRPTVTPVAHASAPNTIPSGTMASAQINQPLSTETSRPGDRFTAELLDPMVDGDGEELVARGAQVDGIVRGIKRSGSAGQSAGLDLQLVGLEQPGQPVLPASIEVAQSPVELTSATTREVLGALAGAAAGAGVGVGIDHTQAGVVVGSTFIGLGVGVLVGYLFGIRDAVLPVGSVVTLRVTQDLRVDHPVAAAGTLPRPKAAAAAVETTSEPCPVVPAGLHQPATSVNAP